MFWNATVDPQAIQEITRVNSNVVRRELMGIPVLESTCAGTGISSEVLKIRYDWRKPWCDMSSMVSRRHAQRQIAGVKQQ